MSYSSIRGLGSARRGRLGAPLHRRDNNVPRSPSPPTGTLLYELSVDSISPSSATDEAAEKVGIENCECIASYNWLNSAHPTIALPGSPPAWTPPSTSLRLQEDNGNFYRDRNAARFPKHPLEPAVRAVLTADSKVLTHDIDLFACSSTIGNLLRLISRVDKPFRFFIESVGDTVFFTRRENSPTELITNVKGYGHTFPEAYTSWDYEVKGSTSHQRLLRYTLGSLECVVRFECDGYLKSKTNQTDPPEAGKTMISANDIEVLLDALEVSAVVGTTHQADCLRVVKSGQTVPQAAVFDLKTRSARRQVDTLEEELPRLWVAQIPNFILARHESGVFKDIQITDVKEVVSDWQRNNQLKLAKLVSILRELIRTVKSTAGGKLEARCKTPGILELREQYGSGYDVLPPSLKEIWVEGLPSGDGTPTEPISDSCKGRDTPPGDKGSECALDRQVESEDFTACSAEECGYCGHCSY